MNPREISRRNFLKTLGTAAAVGTLTAVGCGGSDKPNNSAFNQNTNSSEQQPEPGWARYVSNDLPYQIDYNRGNHMGGDTFILSRSFIEGTASTKIIISAEPTQADNLQEYIKEHPELVNVTQQLNSQIDSAESLMIFDSGTEDDGSPIKSASIIFIGKGLGWQIALSDDPDKFDTNLPEFKKMASTFRFTN